jgi:hypothetical protein
MLPCDVAVEWISSAAFSFATNQQDDTIDTPPRGVDQTETTTHTQCELLLSICLYVVNRNTWLQASRELPGLHGSAAASGAKYPGFVLSVLDIIQHIRLLRKMN